MNLKDKPLVHEAKTPYGVDVKAFYYQDVKEAVLEDKQSLLMLLNRLRRLNTKHCGKIPLKGIMVELELHYKEKKEIFGEWKEDGS